MYINSNKSIVPENTIICGDTISVLKSLPDNSIDCVITSPPYWAMRNFHTQPQIWGGKTVCSHEWKPQYWEKELVQSPAEKRVKRLGIPSKLARKESYLHLSSALCIKCGAWKGELGHEQTFDLFVKHLLLVLDEIKRILKPMGTCWINLGDTYFNGSGRENYRREYGHRETEGTRLQDKTLCLIPYRFAIEMVERRWILRNVVIWYKPNAMPQSAKDRFTVDFEPIFLFVKNKKYYFMQQLESFAKSTLTRMNYPRFGGDNKGYGGYYALRTRNFTEKGNRGRNMRAVWSIPTQPFPGEHFAVFPETLVEPMIKSGCPPNGIVLDPFVGSGTTCAVAKRMGKKYLGIDVNPDYCEMARKRIDDVK